MSDCAIVGVGLTRFAKHPQETLKTLAGAAITEALTDAGIERSEIDVAFVANAMAAITVGQVSVVGQTVLRANGFAGIPVFNIDNACASSASALHLAVHYLRSGAAGTALVVGVEKLYSEERWRSYRALNGAADIDFVASTGVDLDSESVFVKAVYPERLQSYAAKYGLSGETLAAISVKNRTHALNNPLAQFRKPISVTDVLESRPVLSPITSLMCAPIGDGASAVVLAVRDVAKASRRRPVWVRASAVVMGAEPGASPSTIERAAHQAYSQAGVSPKDIDVAEVHDSTAFTELLAYEELGFCALGRARELVAEGATSLNGRLPVNPSGGLESRGHPVAATGLAQIVELVTQLRDAAGVRQVPNTRFALAESAGGFAGGDTAAVAVTVLGRDQAS